MGGSTTFEQASERHEVVSGVPTGEIEGSCEVEFGVDGDVELYQ